MKNNYNSFAGCEAQELGNNFLFFIYIFKISRLSFSNNTCRTTLKLNECHAYTCINITTLHNNASSALQHRDKLVTELKKTQVLRN